MAQTTGTSGNSYDFTSDISAASSNWQSVLSTNGPALFGMLLLALGFGFAWRLVKKAVHSV